MIVVHATASLSLSLWGARPRLVIDHGHLCFLQWLVPAETRWAAPMTRGSVALISPLHTHQKKGVRKWKKGSYGGFGGFPCCSAYQHGVLRLAGLVWGQLPLLEGTGLDPAPSHPGRCCDLRHLMRPNRSGWLHLACGCCCGLNCGTVSLERDSSVGTARTVQESARTGLGATGLTRAVD